MRLTILATCLKGLIQVLHLILPPPPKVIAYSSTSSPVEGCNVYAPYVASLPTMHLPYAEDRLRPVAAGVGGLCLMVLISASTR